jgi:uncharacterized protein (DUF1778 family)
MALAKEQINVRVPKDLARRARRCAAVRNTSVNEWVAQAIETKAAQDYETLKIQELEGKLSQVAQEYLPGRVASFEEMLSMAQVFADEDVADGLPTRHVPTEERSGPRHAPPTIAKTRPTRQKK